MADEAELVIDDDLLDEDDAGVARFEQAQLVNQLKGKRKELERLILRPLKRTQPSSLVSMKWRNNTSIVKHFVFFSNLTFMWIIARKSHFPKLIWRNRTTAREGRGTMVNWASSFQGLQTPWCSWARNRAHFVLVPHHVTKGQPMATKRFFASGATLHSGNQMEDWINWFDIFVYFLSISPKLQHKYVHYKGRKENTEGAMNRRKGPSANRNRLHGRGRSRDPIKGREMLNDKYREKKWPRKS